LLYPIVQCLTEARYAHRKQKRKRKQVLKPSAKQPVQEIWLPFAAY
jgi:hypothetical protein